MGVYIDMEMPKNGSCIQIVIDDDGNVYPTVENCIMKIGSIAKAVSIPPHGRCIDADALVKFINDLYYVTWDGGYAGGRKDACVAVLEKINSAPTIIPAEKAEEGE